MMILSSSPSSSLRAAAVSGPLLPALATALAFGAVLLYRRRRCNEQETRSTFSMTDLQSLILQEEKAGAGSTDCIYLDYNGTTPIHALVLAAMLPFLTVHFGNPSSSHAFGLQPQIAITQARQSLLKLVGKQSDPPSSMWFTGCGTESDNLAIQLAIQSSPPSNRHVVTTNVEHPAIAECLKALEDDGIITVTYVKVQPQVGTIIAQDVIDAIRDDTMLVTVMLANNESGALFPVADIAAACRERNILMHTDAAQACGKVDVGRLVGDSDLITLVGHKIGAPKGVAALYVRPDCCISTNIKHSRGIMLLGGGQEGGRRGGTENVPYIVGMGKAADMAVESLSKNMSHMEALRTRLLEKLREEIGSNDDGEEIRPNGPTDPSQRLPNTLSIGIPGIVSGALLSKIGHQVAASAGAACHSASSAEGSKISAILEAMQIPPTYARGTLRLSVGPHTTMDDVERAAHLISTQVKLEREALANTI